MWVEQEIQQLKNQNEADLFAWLRGNAAVFLSTLVVVIGGLIGLFRWFGDRRDAQDKELKAQAEERFKNAVAALGDEKASVQVGGAILLRSFLHEEDKKSYQRYYPQVFDLAVAYLRLPRTAPPSEDPDTSLPLTTLRQALIVVFKEAFPLARERRKKRQTLESSFLQKIKAWLARTQRIRTGRQLEEEFDPQSLDATGVQLDHAYLVLTDLEQVWMPKAFLRNADLGGADLRRADLSGAKLGAAKLGGANLGWADLGGAKLGGADLGAADLSAADLGWADLGGANLGWADLSGADLGGANLGAVNHLEEARSLDRTNLHGAKGLTKEQLEACKAKGAIIDEDTTTSPPQSPVSPPPSQSNQAQTSSAPPAQVKTPPPGTDGSSAP